jgi:DNA phosphorothioation-dependent restriction protein DptF
VKKQEKYDFTKETKLNMNLNFMNNLSENKFKDMLEVVYNIDNSDYIIIIDYKLYELIYKINEGYSPNKVDRNRHVSFDKAVNKLVGTNTEKIYIQKNNSNREFILKEDGFDGYEFEEVK